MAKRQDAPGRLELVRGFVNSLDLEHGVERFESAAGLRDWLLGAGLLTKHDAASEADRARAVEVREALRSLAVANGVSREATLVLNGVAQTARVTLGFDADGAPTLHSAAGGVSGALGELLTVVALAILDGTWRRMKVCPNPECYWMFYDHSKNRSGTWCQMAECGNRAKVRAYRAKFASA